MQVPRKTITCLSTYACNKQRRKTFDTYCCRVLFLKTTAKKQNIFFFLLETHLVVFVDIYETLQIDSCKPKNLAKNSTTLNLRKPETQEPLLSNDRPTRKPFTRSTSLPLLQTKALIPLVELMSTTRKRTMRNTKLVK